MRRVLGWLLAWIVALWVRSLRLRVIDRTHPSDHALPKPWILVFWHGTQIPLLAWSRRRKTAVMVSWSGDGELQTRVMRRAGMHVVRGSSSRGGARGLVAMVHAMRELSLDAAFAVDGPRGPLGTVHPGALACARHAGGVLVPIGSAAEPVRVLRKAWDRMAIPLPFARAVVVLGPTVRADASESEVAAAIDEANALAARTLSGSPDAAPLLDP
ncbi:MAG: lysophospholipid acyltransferase family protein [Polyangiales bacterium]